jgi:hypothetical protein
MRTEDDTYSEGQDTEHARLQSVQLLAVEVLIKKYCEDTQMKQ